MMNMKKNFKGFAALVVALMMMMSYASAECVEIAESVVTSNSVVVTEVPATEVPATEVPATEVPATEVPATEVPATEVPATEVPATEALATEAPIATEAPVVTETPAVEANDDVEATEELEVVENIVEELVEAGLSTGTVEIVSEKNDYCIGDTVTMKAIITGFEGCAYELQWQFSDNGGKDWSAAAGNNNDITYSFEMTEQNAIWCWRVAVILAV